MRSDTKTRRLYGDEVAEHIQKIGHVEPLEGQPLLENEIKLHFYTYLSKHANEIAAHQDVYEKAFLQHWKKKFRDYQRDHLPALTNLNKKEQKQHITEWCGDFFKSLPPPADLCSLN